MRLQPIALMGISIVVHLFSGTAGTQDSEGGALMEWLDRDRDGLIDAHEGAEAMLFLVKVADLNDDGKLSSRELNNFLIKEAADEELELIEMFEGLDADQDGVLSTREIPAEVRPLFTRIDLDGDKRLDFSEFQSMPLDDPAVFIEAEMLSFLAQIDHDGDGVVELESLPGDLRRELSEMDSDSDGLLTREELLLDLAEELAGARFEVLGEKAIMTGTIGATTPGRVLELILEHPQVRTIEMVDVPGSMDDESMLRAARLVRRAGFNTHLPEGAQIASGGTDFFQAGVVRSAHPSAKLGVHSWAGFGEQGGDLPREHPEHRQYVEYCEEMGIPEEFYWYTLKAAPAEGIHWMSAEEIQEFGLLTSSTGPTVFDPKPGGESAHAYGLDLIDVSIGMRGIVPLPAFVAPVIREHFDRYTHVLAPNGKPIHFLAQAAWSEDQIVHARKVLEHLLCDAPGTRFGSDKDGVANAMADRHATMVLFETQEQMEEALDGKLGELKLGMQDLRSDECPADGSPDYMAHDTRDAAFEEILHLVHDYGIRPALKPFDLEIQRCSDLAAKEHGWDPWPKDEPDSIRNEYIAAAYDNYLDLWTVAPRRYEGMPLLPEHLPEGTSHFGAFMAGSRAALREKDPAGMRMIEAFFQPALTYVAELPVGFEGIFELELNPKLRYTSKSQHLRHVALRGMLSSGIAGNDLANHLTGNLASNTLEGRGGDDVLDGRAGLDTAIFSGPLGDYKFERQLNGMRITDTNPHRDGIDTLLNVELLSFKDKTIELPR